MHPIARMAGQLGFWISRIRGGGSALPGFLALKVDEHILDSIRFPEDTILVTGTNGKTTVTHLLAEIMTAASKTVATNAHGANILQGVVTLGLSAMDKSGQIHAQTAVIEVDEAYVGKVARAVHPRGIYLNNLFDDQVDRFGDKYQLARKMIDSLQGLEPAPTLYANGDDPLTVYVAQSLGYPVHFFGVETEGTMDEDESVACPVCHKPLTYTKRYYDHIGAFHCSCDFDHPTQEWVGHWTGGRSFSLDGEDYMAPYDALYAVYNAVGATAVALDWGISPETIAAALARGERIEGRMEKVQVKGYDTFVNLVKNPAGTNATLDVVVRDETEPYVLIFAAETQTADGTNTGWYASIAFARLQESPLQAVIFCGEGAEALAEAAKKAGLHVPIHQAPQYDWPFFWETYAVKPLFLANYTAMKKLKSTFDR